MTNVNSIKGFKVFDSDWKCRGFQFEVGRIFEENVTPIECERGFHFCKKAIDCFKYYDFNPNNKVAEVIALGEISEGVRKCSTNKIQIVREITWSELIEIVNLGKGNTGLGNTGNSNTGNRNTGDRNTGNRNTGDRNTGDWNTGNLNTGDGNTGKRNTGNGNTGDSNTGNENTGDSNTGNLNTGDGNTGNRNTGNGNAGNLNTGDLNTGDRNTGNRNTGDGNTGHDNTGDGNAGHKNTGDLNTGDWNQGNYNAGDFNISDGNVGCFNTEQHTIKIFDVDTDMTLDEWRNTDAFRLLCKIDFRPTTWVWEDGMTKEEKEDYPTYKTTGGYLRENDLTQFYQKWWDELDDKQREIITNIPNFDATKFKLITGIDAES